MDDLALDPDGSDALAAVEGGDLDEERGAGDGAPRRLDQPHAGLGRAAGGEDDRGIPPQLLTGVPCKEFVLGLVSSPEVQRLGKR